MSHVQLHIIDERMLELIEILKSRGVIKFRQQFCDAIGMKKQTIRRVKIGLAGFTKEHIEKVCSAYDVNPNWVFGYSKQVFRSDAQRARIVNRGRAEEIAANKKANKANKTGGNTIYQVET